MAGSEGETQRVEGAEERASPVQPPSPRSLGEVAAVFLKLGVIAFGGPAAHVAFMRREIVEKRHWLDAQQFLDYFAGTQLIPGPSSTELAILLGYKRGGWRALILAGVLFILPAMLIMLGLAVLYTRYASSHAAESILYGVRPAVVAIVAWALLDLGRRVFTSWPRLLLGAAILALGLLTVNPVLLLLVAGLAMLVPAGVGVMRQAGALGFPWLAGTDSAGIALGRGAPKVVALFLTFLKLGAVSYGTGYVLLVFLHADFVTATHWLTDKQVLDAVAISQATPGPVFTTATFIGYLVAGVPGALLGTLGIFLPGFLLVPLLDRIMELAKRHGALRSFLQGVNVGALGLIAAVTVELGRSSIVGIPTALIAATSFAVLVWRPLAAPAVVVTSGIVGLLLRYR